MYASGILAPIPNDMLRVQHLRVAWWHRERAHSNQPNTVNSLSDHQHPHIKVCAIPRNPIDPTNMASDVRRPHRRTPPGHRRPPRFPHHPSPDGLALPLSRGSSQQHSLQPDDPFLRPEVLGFHGYVGAKERDKDTRSFGTGD